jgi:hypothetical protein
MRAAQACSGSRGAAWVAPQRAPPASGRRRVPRALPDAQDADAALFAQLVQQASVRPAARVAQRVLQPDPWHAAAEAPAAAAAAAAVTAPRALAAPARRPHPARMPFDAMYTQLAAWRARYLSCHVPRFCFDAPVLGAWVRWLRKEHKEQRLERWKMDRWGGMRGHAGRGNAAVACPAPHAGDGQALEASCTHMRPCHTAFGSCPLATATSTANSIHHPPCAAPHAPPCEAAAPCSALLRRLNLLDFEWQLTDADAKWYNSYHQLRRFKAIHGHTRLPADYRSREDRDWVRVARWEPCDGASRASPHPSSGRRPGRSVMVTATCILQPASGSQRSAGQVASLSQPGSHTCRPSRSTCGVPCCVQVAAAPRAAAGCPEAALAQAGHAGRAGRHAGRAQAAGGAHLQASRWPRWAAWPPAHWRCCAMAGASWLQLSWRTLVVRRSSC